MEEKFVRDELSRVKQKRDALLACVVAATGRASVIRSPATRNAPALQLRAACLARALQ